MLAIMPLRVEYGDRIAVEYFDPDESEEAQSRMRDLKQSLGYEPAMPFVLVNGELALEGWVSSPDIGRKIDQVLGSLSV